MGVMQAAAALVAYAGLAVRRASRLRRPAPMAMRFPPSRRRRSSSSCMRRPRSPSWPGAALARIRPGFLIAGLLLLVGVSLFSGDIAARTVLGHRLFPMAAPTGGSIMIFGWLVLAAAGIWELLAHRG